MTAPRKVLQRAAGSRPGTVRLPRTEQHATWHEVMEACTDAVMAIDSRGTIILFNSAAERMFARAAPDVLGCDSADLLRLASKLGARSPQSERASELEKLVGAVVDLEGNRKSGESFFVEGSLSRVSSGGEDIYLGILRETTARKALEARMAVNESRFRRLFESNIVGVIISVTTGEICEANDAFLATTGYTRADMPLRWDQMTPPEWRYTDIRAIEELAVSGVATPWEKEYIRKDGLRVPVLVGGALLDGSEHQVVAFVLDLTELKREELARQAAESKALALQAEVSHAARLSALGEMASGLAHELNQPLGAIANYLDGSLVRIAEDPIDRESVARALRKSRREAERAARIIRGLRGFLRRRDARYSAANLNTLLHEVEQIAAPELRALGVRLELRLEQRLPTALVDVVQIEQVILNLIRNSAAALATLPSSERIIAVDARALADREIEVIVRDRGCGFSDEVAAAMFRPFFTTGSDGLGLGLAISRSIIEAHGGRIWAECSAEAGTALCFRLPANRRAARERRASRS